MRPVDDVDPSASDIPVAEVDLHAKKLQDPARPRRYGPLKITPCTSDVGKSGQLVSSVGQVGGSSPMVLERERVIRPACDGEDAPEGIETTWFEISGVDPIQYPPDFVAQPVLEPGDLFYYRHPTIASRSQLWILVANAQGEPHWKAAHVGIRREKDGRRLTLSPKKKNPSWVAVKWYQRRLHEQRLGIE
ncbi:hypothetical protein PYCCODRAFT_1467317 [Trametes coccinea BRFM310]|uniref:Uncharacterized protein n=1 Tax=Trametes coccinea (strain BRFM310) TaxID=1353009 RepID=A0A1Y2IPG2_TRAC3|nr:hypothetical protein PYCCODRAFT_1467317 [Trametes coccinea BRFM310]